MALIEKGNVNIKKEGAKVGGWFTRVAAAQISTFSFGGDSHIRVSKTGEILIGPQKVYPVSHMCDRFPYLENELKHVNRNGEYKAYFPYEAESYILNDSFDEADLEGLSETERKVIAAPAPAWKDTIARLTGTEIIIPPYASVANAVGAAVCKIIEKIEMTIIRKNDEIFLMSSEGRHVYSSEEECMFYAVHLGRKEIEHRLRAAGVQRWEITEEMHSNEENTHKTLIITGVGI